MSLLFIDGFDAYGTDGVDISAAMQAAGYVGSGFFASTSNSSASSNTRTGVGYSCNISFWKYGGIFTRNFLPSSSVVMGFAFNMLLSGFRTICALGYNNLLGSSGDLVKLSYNGANGITAQIGGNAFFSPPNVMFQNVWHFIEVKYTPGSLLEIKIDGVVVIRATGTQTGSPGITVNYARWGTEDNNASLLDDVYICDQAGSSFNDYLGDVVVHSILPKADAGTNMMSKVGGSVGHFTAVNDNPPDFDASYLYSNTSGDKELFTLCDFPNDIIDVLAVGVNILAKKSAPGVGFYQAVCVVGGVEVDSPNRSAPIQYVQTQFLLTSPPGGGTWTLSAAQNAQIGVKIP